MWKPIARKMGAACCNTSSTLVEPKVDNFAGDTIRDNSFKERQGGSEVMSGRAAGSASARQMMIKVLVTATVLWTAAAAQSSAGRTDETAPGTARRLVTAAPSRYTPTRFPKRARSFYELVWGVDSLTVKSAESGEVIRFSYRVVDPEKARVLNDKKSEPYLIDEAAHVKLVVPSMEKVGLLRQSSAPEADKSYWMVFSNKGRYVKPGDRVNVVIGNFRANGLVVQ
jgi:hypothetical protein